MKLEKRKFYQLRNGGIVGPMISDIDRFTVREGPWSGASWDSDGRYIDGDCDHEWDCVSEIVEMNEVPESPKVAQGAAKTPLALIPPVAADATAKVHQFGAERYGPWNWRENKVPLMTYLHAMRRHLDAVLDGQDLDPDSGLPHVAHVAASCNIIMDAAAFGTLVDDRPRARPL